MSESASVAALLVSHDGARWLPKVIEGVRAQTVAPARVLAVDTASRDETPELLAAAFGESVRAPAATTYPAAVRLGLDRLAALPDAPEWVWLLHDDTNPEPRALAALLAAAVEHPEADVLGPKLREWPSLRRLLEVGITISGTGRRELGLERGEYDQGQHDDVRAVLAVNTAGMLVRRRVLEELGGFDDQLPIFGNDIDFGWRVAAAGYTTLVVPSAVVFHAEAAHQGVRRTPLTGRHTHYQERRAALYTLLANSPGRHLPFQVVRLALGTLLRMVGFFLVRSPGEAFDDLAALVSIYSKPGQIRSARHARRATRSADPAVAARVKGLLAPPWLPYRHGLDAVGDLVSALTDQASDVAERRRAAAAELDPSSMAARWVASDTSDLDDPDREDAFEDTGVVARFLTNPVAVLLAVFVVVALVLARPAYGAVTGAGLSPVPEGGVGDWWRLHFDSWHQLGAGTDVPAPAYLLPLALLGSVLGATAAVSALLVLAVPLALWGSWRFLRVAGRLVSPLGAPRWLLLIGATTYSLVPVVSGAWGEGRLGAVVVAVLLPWFAHAALGFADPDPDRRWRAAWRSAVLLALITAFAPVAWPFAIVLALMVVAAATAIVPAATVRDDSVWGPPAAALAAVPVLLLPWWLPSVLTGAGEGLLLDTGRLPAARIDDLGMLTGRIAGSGAPSWVGWLLLALAVLALVPRLSRIPVIICWMVAAAAGLVAALLAQVSLSLAALSTPAGLNVLLTVIQSTLIVAVVLGLLGAVRGGLPSWTVIAGAVAAAVVPLAGLSWFGVGLDEPLTDDDIPAYMVQRSMTGPERGILVVRGDVDDGLTYSIRRGDGATLGEDEIVALSPESTQLTSVVRRLASRPSPEAVGDLAGFGVEYVVLPGPADPSVAAGLDATGGLTQASAERGTRAWEVARDLDPGAVDGSASVLRIFLLVLQGLAIVWVLVLCAPTANRRGE